MVAKIAYIKSPSVVKIMVIRHTQICYTAKAEATSFLRSSYGHPQVQTVPSSTWDAPCPVVTPSPKGLGSAFSVCLYYTIFYQKSKGVYKNSSIKHAEALLPRRAFNMHQRSFVNSALIPSFCLFKSAIS